MTDDIWDSLLGRISDGLVVPVVGPQLLIDPAGGGSTQALVATRLLAVNKPETDAASLAPGHELDAAVALLQRDGRIRPQALYEAVYKAMAHVTADDAAIPLPLRQLAEVAGFRLLVTVTPDDMLARCLRWRCRVEEAVHSPNLSSAAGLNDLPADWQARPDEVHLLYLFGKAQRTPVFAIHEEDVLEYTHNIVARGSNVPVAFLAELQSRDLIFIGCRLPDWLSRIFLRATNKDRLSRERQKREWMVERLQPGESLTLFLNSYSKDTEILSQVEPAAFVAELHRRWFERPGAATPVAGEPQAAGPRGALFFVSYSRSTDLTRAEALVRALLQLGVKPEEIWFDREDIEPGQAYEQRIVDGIRACRYFVPMLSEAALARSEAFVFSEWREANQRLRAMGREFIVPLVVDADYAPDRYAGSGRPVPDWPVSRWSGIDFGHAPEGVPDERTLNHLKALVRQARTGGGPA